jgi:5-(carboxyamino)imidazole ribonucleotide synthase
MKNAEEKPIIIGVLGGGQLGMMLLEAARSIDATIKILEPDEASPAASICSHFVRGSFQSESDVLAFGKDCDIITIEIEHVHVGALRQLKLQGKKVYPDPDFLEMVQDKGMQKQYYERLHIPTAPFTLREGKPSAADVVFPCVWKSRKGGYDGKGVCILHSSDDIARLPDGPCLIETCADISKEISVIASRDATGRTSIFPLVEMEFNPSANLVEFLISPASITAEIESKAKEYVMTIMESAGFVGLLAVEFFITQGGELWVNEMAPRPHNSGHHTIEACATSQYEQHLRALLNLTPGNTQKVAPFAAMINILGDTNANGIAQYTGLEVARNTPGVYIHLYGKKKVTPFRKMGHITIIGNDLAEVKENARRLMQSVRCISGS